ncbi:SulP family inorganic anion transporter [Aquirhabdus sp.]|uniref:SulP family inorganic anion transporter n=1 Tax=Aquirhabdus sp. TaxID=2824160 RepID=UPI00396CC559
MLSARLQMKDILKDSLSGLVVFLVALPLCLGIAHASGAPILSGIIAGVIGGIVVGALSGSHISVSGPAAGLTAIILAQLDKLHGNYEAFLFTMILAGILQLVFSALKLGFFANYIPSNVIRGLLAAIGIILILTQLPHLVGYSKSINTDNISFVQSDGSNTFTALLSLNINLGAALIGFLCIATILLWDKTRLKKTMIPSALVAVVLGAGLNSIFIALGSPLAIVPSHLINLPDVMNHPEGIFLFPDFSYWNDPVIYTGAITLAIVASLETLLNLEASEKIDPFKRAASPNRELFAQGTGNTLSGFLGGMPITSVIVRSSVNASSGARTRFSAIFHGFLLIIAVLALPSLINTIPLSALAAILILTGFKLASPALFYQMYSEGWKQFWPFVVTVVAIIFTDLLVGIIIGLVISMGFILHSNLRRGVHTIKEHHVGGDVTRLQLGSQVSFLNRAALSSSLNGLPNHANVIIDASITDYIDPDIYQLIIDFRDQEAVMRHIKVSLIGFKKHYSEMEDQVQHVDVSTREVQTQLTPAQVLTILKEGNQRFVKGERLHRDMAHQVSATSSGQHPIAAVLGCMDSRSPTELIFDLGVGDIFSMRIAGNIAGQKVLGSMEFACNLKGSKLLVVLGHTDCGAVTAACKMAYQNVDVAQSKEAPHIKYIIGPIMQAVQQERGIDGDEGVTTDFVNRVAIRNVQNTMIYIRNNSDVLRGMIERGEVALVGALYDVGSGEVTFFEETAEITQIHKPALLPA